MKGQRAVAMFILGAWLFGSGCMAMREVPPALYADQARRKGVRVQTREGLVYEFDYATFDPDSLTGYRTREDLEGVVDQVAVHRIPLDDIQRMTSRRVDWYRTGLVGGSVISGALAIGLTQMARHDRAADGGGPRCCFALTPAPTGH